MRGEKTEVPEQTNAIVYHCAVAVLHAFTTVLLPFTGQLVSIPSYELADFPGTKFYSPHTLADSN